MHPEISKRVTLLIHSLKIESSLAEAKADCIKGSSNHKKAEDAQTFSTENEA
jgi:hypothetical protein